MAAIRPSLPQSTSYQRSVYYFHLDMEAHAMPDPTTRKKIAYAHENTIIAADLPQEHLLPNSTTQTPQDATRPTNPALADLLPLRL